MLIISEALLRLMFGAENFTMDMEQATTLVLVVPQIVR